MPFDYELPEGLLGSMLAIEGVKDSFTLIHGPTGCKFYPASHSEECYRCREKGEPIMRNLFTIRNKYFFSQPRLPCTYLDNNGFIRGSQEKLEELYEKVVSMNPKFIGIINAPGASIVGEDLTSVQSDIPTIRLDDIEFSETAGKGFQKCIEKILDIVPPVPSCEKNGINLIGISIMHLNWKDSIDDLTKLLALCDVKVNCVIGAGWDVNDIRNSANSELNVVICPEYCDSLIEKYKEEYEIPYVSIEGSPIGFDCLESWIKTICLTMNKDATLALEKITEQRKKVFNCLKMMELSNKLPKGRTFSIEGDDSFVYSLSTFLYSYLGMIPVALHFLENNIWKEKTLSFFKERNIPISEDVHGTLTDVVLGSGPLCSSALHRGIALKGIDIMSPSRKRINVIPVPILGLEGTVRILDDILNNLFCT